MLTQRTPFLISLITLLLLVVLLPAEVHAQSWYNASWSYRKAITIDVTKVGTGGPHPNYPVLVSRADTDLQTKAQTTGNDILFTSVDGTTKLDHEIESYTSASGTLVAWVEIPSLSSAANTVIYMYYGNAAAIAQQNVTGTWNTNFQGVYHLNGVFTDATTNARNGTNTGTTTVTGKISGGRGFVRSNGADFITITGLMGSAANVTLSAWATLTTRDTTGAHLISLGDVATINMEDITDGLLGSYQSTAGSWTLTKDSPITNTAGTGWRYVVYTINDTGNAQILYLNGLAIASTATTNSIIYTGLGANTIIGKHAAGSTAYDFDGSIDEVRVSNSIRSAGWILTEFNNQNSPATFYSVGSEATNAITYYSLADGNWNTAATWSTTGHTGAAASTAPGTVAGDTVIIGNSDIVTLNVDLTTVQTNVTINSTGTLNMGTHIMGSTGSFTLNTGGTLGIGSTAGITSSGLTGNVQVSGTRTFSTGANYTYDDTLAQVTGNGLPATVNNLTISNTAGVTLSAGLTVTSALTIAASSTLTSGVGITALIVTGTLSTGASALLDLGTTTVLSGTLTTISNTGTIKTSVLTTTSAVPIPAGKTWGGTIDYANTDAQTVVGGTYNNLTVRPGNGKTTTASGNLVVNGTLTVTTANGNFDLSTFVLSGALTGISNFGNIKTSVPTTTSATPIPVGKTWNGTIYFNAPTGAQTVVGGTYNILTINNTSGTNTADGNLTVNNQFRTTAGGTLDMGSAYRLINGGGTITNHGTVKTSVLTSTSASPLFSGRTWGGTGTVEYAATSGAQTVMSGTFNNLKLSHTSGTNTAMGNITVGGILTFTAGTLTTGAFTLTLTSTGTVTRTTGHVIGNFKKNIAIGATSKTYEVGSTSAYTPLTILFASVTTAGDLTASTTASDHANITSATINASKSVNRTWTLTNSGIVFTTYDVTFTFVAGDVDAGATTSAFIVGRYNAGWTYPTVGTKTATTTQATGLTDFSDYQLGEFGGNYLISGTVFEDQNYGGGSGRSLASSSGVTRDTVRVELYTAAGAYVSFATTDGSGAFSFGSLAPATYTVRVVNSSVTSGRGGTSLLAVQTYRTTASSGAAVAVTDHVGGETPALADAGNGSTTLAALTTGTTTAQSITTATLGASSITGVDFGYSFNVIVNKNNTGQGSLRQFLTNANALPNTGLAQAGLTAGIDNAVFMLADGTARAGLTASYASLFVSGIASIALTSALPQMSSPVIIDARLQPNYTTTPVVELDGTATTTVSGFDLTGGGSTIGGFIINRFDVYGINISTSGSNTIQGNYIGTNAAGTAASANTSSGIYINNVASNLIGGTTATARNLISGNTGRGMWILGASATSNTIQGNYIGTNEAGTAAIPNTLEGIRVDNAPGNTIGGTAAGAGNVVSGNTKTGVSILGASPHNNIVQGNYIGTNATGTAAVANGESGVYVFNGTGIVIGGTTAAARNIISGNLNWGLRLVSAGVTLQGNYIGLNVTGTAAIGNLNAGIYLAGPNSTIGGTTAGERNVISGNVQSGVHVTNATAINNAITGNYIGTNAAGTAALANGDHGIEVTVDAANNSIGGTAAGAGNLISGNSKTGVVIISGTGNAILSNAIYGNTNIGIDLTNDGVSANDGTKSGTLANSGMDTPVFTSALLNGTNLTLVGYVGSAASQTTFASATVQIFKSDNDASTFGEGQTYLGTLTTDANGNFSGTITASGLSGGDKITATATDGTNNTSEFGLNAVLNADPLVTLLQSVLPSGTQAPGTDLVYTFDFTNGGGTSASIYTVIDPIPSNTDFKVASVTTNLKTTGLTVAVAYSNDNAATWSYTPVSGGGGAAANYDRAVTHVRWSFTGNLSQTAPNNTGTITLTAKIR